MKRRLIRYFELLEICREINQENDSSNIKRNISVIQDVDGNNIVMINDIRFKGKRSVEWKDVRAYLKEYVGEFYTIAATGDVIFIASDLPNEYSGSKYTHSIKGANAKAKANAAQGIALPIYDEAGERERYNVFHASLIVRHSEDSKLYLYDILDINAQGIRLFGKCAQWFNKIVKFQCM